MKYRTIGVTAALGLCLLTTACTEETKEQLEDTVITIEFGDGKTDQQDINETNPGNDMAQEEEQSLTAAEVRFPLAGTTINNTNLVIVPSHDDAPLWLDVGTTENGEDIFNASITGTTQVPNIPLNGQPVFISLWTQLEGEWTVKKYRFDTLDNFMEEDSNETSDSDDTQSGSENTEQDKGESNTGDDVMPSVTYEIKAIDGNFIVQAGQQLSGQLQAIDLNGSALQFEVTSQPQYGSLQLNPDSGAFTYQANNQSNGTKDSFAYCVFDGQVYSAPAIVRFNYSEHSAVTLQGRTDGVGADLVIVAEGFTEGDMPYFHHTVNKYIEFMFGYEPEFVHHQKAWNIHRIDLVSAQNGSDSNYGTDTRNTALDSGFNCSNIQRLLCVNATKTFDVVNSVFPQWDNILVIVNSSTYGGAGYSSGIGTVSMASSAMDVALHEMAHSFAGLGDEYAYGGSSAPNREPSAANLTINNDNQTVKWSHWIGKDPKVGLFEGGKYVSTGVWRPTQNSFMRSLGQPFHSVNKEAWTLAVYEHGGVVLNQLPSQSQVMQNKGGDTLFYVETLLEPAALQIEWSVNGQVVPELNGKTQVSVGANQQNDFTVSVAISDATQTIIKDPQNHSRDEVRWSVSVQ